MFAEAVRSGDRHSTVFGRGLDATNSFFDGLVHLPPAGNEHLGRAVPDRAPQELERLGQKRSRCRWLQRVPPLGFTSSGSVVDRGEGEFATIVGGVYDGGPFPFETPDAVVSTKPRAGRRRGGAFQPFAAIALRAPFAHAGYVGYEVVNQLGRSGDIDRGLAALSSRHDVNLSVHSCIS